MSPKARNKKRNPFTPEELEQRREHRSLATRVKNNCIEYGLSATKAQLEYLQKAFAGKHKVILPSKLSIEDTISAFELGISRYEESMNDPSFRERVKQQRKT